MAHGMLVKPRLRHSFSVEVVEPRALFLFSEHKHHVFEGEVYTLLPPLLDGEHTFPQILAEIGDKVSVPELYSALTCLVRSGCIVEGGVPLPEHAAFWDHLKGDSQQVASRQQQTRVKVETIGDLAAEGLAEALVGAGLLVCDDEDDSDRELIRIVATDDYLRPELEEINRDALANERGWILMKPGGMVIWIGPFMRPGTGCWRCLETRLRANRQVESYIQKRSDRTVQFRTSRARLASTLKVGMNLAATEIAKAVLLDGDRPQDGSGLDGKIITLDLLMLALEEHRLVKRPQCPACGQEAERVLEPKPLVLRSGAKRPWGSGDQRTVSPRETFERYKHHISPITGVVTSLKSREVNEFGVAHNYVAGHYFPVPFDDVNLLRGNMIARSGGKGTTEAQARTSAVCESIERYSGIRWGEEKTVQASYLDLRPKAIHIRDVLLFSEEQYRTRDEWNAKGVSHQQYVPEPLDDRASIAWSPVWSISSERFSYLPTAYCYYGHLDPGHLFCRCDSNGNAAGNTVEEAIVQGFLELVERDSVALWWYNRVRRPAVDVDSFELPYWESMKSYYRDGLNRELHVLDVTADLAIPTFVVVSRRTDRPVEDILVGFGCHLDPRTAMLRALAEGNQYLPALRHSSPDGSTVYYSNDGETIDWWKSATYDNQAYLVPDPDVPSRVLSDYRSFASDDVLEDVTTCVRTAEGQGLEVFVLDQTRPDLGLPVVKVVVPGLRHFWRRLAPGRLYDVPVQLDWLQRPLGEIDMNPTSCFV